MTALSGQTPNSSYLVVRSAVGDAHAVSEYRPQLRIDFWYSCAYCTMSEVEALGIGFHIDHYEPLTMRPDLESVYSNLMYACAVCNHRKWKWSPPDEARKAGLRFFKADIDDAADHFTLSDDEIAGKSNVGTFTIELLELNRDGLIRLRKARKLLADSLEEIVFGLRALTKLPVDRLAESQKMKVRLALSELSADKKKVEAALRELCRSPLLDDEVAGAHTASRQQHLKDWRVQYPGRWHSKDTGGEGET